jgi:acetate kinase
MKVAVINSGSSSLKYKLFDLVTLEVLDEVLVQNIGEDGSEFQTHADALAHINLEYKNLDAIGHRVVHGGEYFTNATRVDDEVISRLKSIIPLAPLHNPANILGMELTLHNARDVANIAVFDTAFHATMPKSAFLYALPKEMYEKHHIRRYGFHGTSHSYISKQAAKILQKPLDEIKLITLHLGNGASVCAVERGKSIDTSMGFTPLEGLIMGSRSGDIDPAIVLYMQRELGMSLDEVDKTLNKKSGLLGICDENDLRKILASKEENARVALSMMIRRIQKYIGAYMALLGEVDAIVFSGGIGENSAYIREKVLDSKLFENTPSFVVKTDEELEIALECKRVLDGV